MTIEPWSLLNEEEISPSPWFRIFKRKYQLPNGKIVDDFFVSKLGDVAQVIVKTKEGNIVMVKQFKPGFGKIMLELPAGRFKSDKTAEEMARMELKEETGIEVGKLIKLGESSEMPTKDPMTIYSFYTEDILRTGERDLDETEEIEVILVPEEEIEGKIKNGEIVGTGTISALYLAKINGYLK